MNYTITLDEARQIADMAASLDYAKNLIPTETPWRAELAVQSAAGHALVHRLLGDDLESVYASEPAGGAEDAGDAWAKMKREVA